MTMRRLAITNDDYLPLALETWEFLAKKLGEGETKENLSVKDLAILLGVCEAIKASVGKTLKDMGHDFQTFDLGEGGGKDH